MYITIETLWKQGYNKSEIARLTNHDWKTISKVIKQLKNGQTSPQKLPHPKLLDSYNEKIVEWLEHGLTGVRIHEELKDIGVSISYSTVKKYMTTLKKRSSIHVRFHPLPGEEAQVDFGYVGMTFDNRMKKRKTWVFNMRLSYSRLDYDEKVYDQTVETFIQCHINAFRSFNGVPKYIKIDNLKSAILEANFYEPIYQRTYKQFAEYYQFNPLPCRVRQPQEKGKTESGIKYIKRNFFLGRKFKDGDDLDKRLRYWLNHTCNGRIHGTTRKIPKEVFEAEEKNKLIKLPNKDFHLSKVGQRIVYNDCHVYIEYNYYSVPFEYVGKTVEIEVCKELVRISYEGTQITIHARCEDKGKFITNESHYPKFKLHLSTEYQEAHQVKMNNIGNHAGQLFLFIITKQPRDWHRTVKGILSLTKKFSSNVVDLACKRALAYGVTQYRAIKNICSTGCYHLPVEINLEDY